MTNEQWINKLMQMNRDMTRDSEFEAVLLEALQDTYKRGADSIRNSPDYNYREDMGR